MNTTLKELRVLKDDKGKPKENKTNDIDIITNIGNNMSSSEKFSTKSSMSIYSTNKNVSNFSSSNAKFFTTLQSQLKELVNKTNKNRNPIETQVPKSIDQDFSQTNDTNLIYHGHK